MYGASSIVRQHRHRGGRTFIINTSMTSIAAQTARLANQPMTAITRPSKPARHAQRLSFDWRQRALMRGTVRTLIEQTEGEARLPTKARQPLCHERSHYRSPA